MLDPDYVEEMTENEWVYNPHEGEEDCIPESREDFEEYNKVRDDAPEEFKKKWKEFVELFKQYG